MAGLGFLWEFRLPSAQEGSSIYCPQKGHLLVSKRPDRNCNIITIPKVEVINTTKTKEVEVIAPGLGRRAQASFSRD